MRLRGIGDGHPRQALTNRVLDVATGILRGPRDAQHYETLPVKLAAML